MKILITGGASGLGASIVRSLAADNKHQVYFTYSRSADAAKEIEREYDNATSFFCDFNNTSSVSALIEQISAWGIDVLINNAYGSISKEHFYKTDPDAFLRSFEQNVLPVLRITQEAMKCFRKQKSGKIINVISSYVLNKPPTGLSAYVANKSYLLSMSKSWANEGVKFNITSNSISPSFMLTGLTEDTDERVIEQMIEGHPLKRLLTTGEVAETVMFLTAASSHINGANLVINAGADII